MSFLVSGEPKQQKVSDEIRITTKCRIPQRLPPSAQQRLPIYRTKAPYNTDTTAVRTKSANRGKDEVAPGRQHTPIRSAHPERERLLAAPKRPSVIPKRVTKDDNKVTNKVGRSNKIVVPVIQRPTARMTYNKTMVHLPDQEIIKQCEDLELKQSELSDPIQRVDINKKESLSSGSEKGTQLKIVWQDKLVQFEKIKNELKDRQKAILELYASMGNTHHKMTELGQVVTFPPPEDLRIMNVGKMSPEQLLQLCTVSRITNRRQRHDESQAKIPLTVDISKLYNMPAKLIATCDQTLIKIREIIDFFGLLKAKEKDIMSTKKIHELQAENEMLRCSLDQVKAEFSKDFDGIIDYIRRAVNKTVDLELRTEELTIRLSQLDSQNADLRKQINNADHLKSSHWHKNKLEDLERQLKEEKCKNSMIKDQLSTSKGQIKMYTATVTQLEATLEQSRSHVYNLERTVQQLHQQNQQLQSDFDKELNKLTESIKENTAHLEEIADAREKLQKEKEDLEKRLGDLSEYYNGSLANLKHEMHVNVSRLLETEKKYDHEVEERKKIEARAESVYAQLVETGLQQKELVTKLEEQESKLNKMSNIQTELEISKRELERANKDKEEYNNRSMKQSEAIMDIECNFKKSIELEENLKHDLATKEEYITELEKKLSLLEQQLQESECKMSLYEKKLTSMKIQISELQDDFGEFENLNELHEMINQQRANLLEATRQNKELSDALQNKEIELEHHMDNLAEQEHLIEQRDGVIKMLSKKDEEQTNIIKLLQNNVEMRTLADSDFNQQLAEKNTEIESLINNLETRKKQISQLEQIILTLENQTRKASVQIKKHQDKIVLLEQKINELETYQLHMDNKRISEAPTDNLDNLIKLLEDELGTAFEPHVNKEREFVLPKKKHNGGDRKREKREKFECHEGYNPSGQTEYESIPTKIAMGNIVKKTYISTDEEQFKGDNLDRKKAITNMDTQKWNPAVDSCADELNTPQTDKESNYIPIRGIIPHTKDNYLSRNLQFLATNQLRDEKKCKMFKFAGHRL